MKDKWFYCAGIGLLLGCMLLLQRPGSAELTAGGRAELEISRSDGPPLAALTFDDGPRSDTTGPLLDGLALREVPATFFLVGERIPGNEQLLRRMKEEGHQIGVHTFGHVMLTKLDREEYEDQIGRTRALIEKTLGPGDYWLRPPYGIYDEKVQRWADGPLVLWSVDPEDWKDRDRERIVHHVLDQVRDGDIVLLHDIYQSSVEAALEITDRLRDRGFCFVTVEQLMESRDREPVRGRPVSRVRPLPH